MSCETKLEEQFVEVVQAYICDRCKRRIEPGGDDIFELQEMLHWRMTGGYGSVFGDMSEISLDLCQSCTKEVLGAWVQIKHWGEE